MEVYHGTILNFALNIEENGIDLTKSNEYLDFGRGFYVTPDKKMAENMAFIRFSSGLVKSVSD